MYIDELVTVITLINQIRLCAEHMYTSSDDPYKIQRNAIQHTQPNPIHTCKLRLS